jgi:hypothetical protein
MPRKMYKPEEIVAKLQQVDTLVSQGASMADAIRQLTRLVPTDRNWRCAIAVARHAGSVACADAAWCVFQLLRARSALHSAVMRRWNAFGFSAKRRPARRAAFFRCAARRPSITGVSRERQGASGW